MHLHIIFCVNIEKCKFNQNLYLIRLIRVKKSYIIYFRSQERIYLISLRSVLITEYLYTRSTTNIKMITTFN